MAIKRQKLMCDFETTTDPNDCRVWASCAVDIETGQLAHLSTSIDEFMEFLKESNSVCYFHNLKFDGSFIIDYLLRNGYKYQPLTLDETGRRKPVKPKLFDCVISDMGMFYSITVIFDVLNKNYKKVVFYDSLKKLPFPVAKIAKDFKLPISKGSIDYDAPRPVGYQLSEEEKEYIITDCQIVASALKIQFEQNMTKMTAASDAIHTYKTIIGKKRFETIFPPFPVALDTDIRRAYKGGYVYLNPKYKNVRGLQGVTFDVNSLYPWVLYSKLLPYGYPVYFDGKYVADQNYPLYISHIKATFELKPDHLPTIQLKNNPRFKETEYLTTSKVKIGRDIEDEPVPMWLTNVDLALFFDHYDVTSIEYINGFKFKGIAGLFKDYIDHWMHIKETTTGALRQLAKLQLNSLYGKFATNPRVVNKIPYMDKEENAVKYDESKESFKSPVYTALAAFVTSYAREKTVRSGQSVFNRFIYADTDSLHLTGFDIPPDLEVHPTHLGAWKNEGLFTDSKFIRAKTYMETEWNVDADSLKKYCLRLNSCGLENVFRKSDGIHSYKTKVTCAGMPDNVKELVTYENFSQGKSFPGKLVPVRCPGGVVLRETLFTIN